ncbi:hypothetical protein DFR70_13033 [Nocardia tenerifensis]|uniref:Uncharacterized protein n=1 Tax=Nocardia tenerifensis TaxID=228006 RepID=A0A318JKE2_9NOCA|nr:hypothetical protein [Nocardia tenerifensis]PXX52785.1 hypothetical protein DFR70_13033 [Nocardia tenerifensis]
MRDSDAYLWLHSVAGRFAVGVAMSGVGMLIGAVSGAYFFGQGTPASRVTVVATVAVTVVVGAWFHRSGALMAHDRRRELEDSSSSCR